MMFETLELDEIILEVSIYVKEKLVWELSLEYKLIFQEEEENQP